MWADQKAGLLAESKAGHWGAMWASSSAAWRVATLAQCWAESTGTSSADRTAVWSEILRAASLAAWSVAWTERGSVVLTAQSRVELTVQRRAACSAGWWAVSSEHDLAGLRVQQTVVLKDEHLADSRAVRKADERAGRSAASMDESWAALRAEHWEFDSVGPTAEPKVARMALLMAAPTGNLTVGWSVDSKAAVRAVH